MSTGTVEGRAVDHDSANDELLKRSLAAASKRLRHPELPLHLFVGDFADDDDYVDDDESEWIVLEHDREPALARRGALIAAAGKIIDTCIGDLQYLDFEPDGLPNQVEAEDSFVFSYFPRQHRTAYNEQFFRNVLVCAVKVAQDLADPHGGRASCTAEEIVRNAVVENALELCEQAGVGPPALHPTEFLLEDADFEYLYSSDMDGVENDQTLQVGLGIHVPAVEDWFAPFNDERLVHPYVETEPTARYSMHDLPRRLNEDDYDLAVLKSTDVIDSAALLSGLTPISEVVGLARRAESSHDPDLWIADDSDPEESFSALIRATTLSEQGSGWISWQSHEGADTIRTDRVITVSPHRHFPVGRDEPWAQAAIGIGRIIAIPLRAVVSYRPDPEVYRRWNEAFSPSSP